MLRVPLTFFVALQLSTATRLGGIYTVHWHAGFGSGHERGNHRPSDLGMLRQNEVTRMGKQVALRGFEYFLVDKNRMG